MLFRKSKDVECCLNESMLYFQKVTVDEDEAVTLKEILRMKGWGDITVFMMGATQTEEEALTSLNGLIDKGLVWWTEVNGERWYRLKPMPKKEVKKLAKALDRR